MDNKNKILLKQCHDNTHSTSRIFRNVELIKKINEGNLIINEKLTQIEIATRECRNQIDILYETFKSEKL